MTHPKLVEKSVVAASHELAVEALAVEPPDAVPLFAHYDICFVALLGSNFQLDELKHFVL